MQIKIASASDWAGMRNHLSSVEVKLSSAGLVGTDARKLAAEVGDRFVHEVRKIEDQLDQVNNKYAHIISCGCTECLAPIENADAWGKVALERDMHTYLKHAKCFRDHINGKNDRYYGRPKVAFFDGERGYGRLLGEYYATEKAAREENAKHQYELAKIANLECDAIDRGEPIKVSHGTKISHDTCSICGNNAPTRKKYCKAKYEGGDCPLFGCTNGLAKLAEDGRMQFVHNDDNNLFYDISSIGLDKNSSAAKPTDCFCNRVRYRPKQGSVSRRCRARIGLARRADATIPTTRLVMRTLSAHQERMAMVAVKLAECSHEPGLLFDDYSVDVSSLRRLVSADPSVKRAAVQDLAMRREVIGPKVFAKICGAGEALASEVASLVPNVFRVIYENDRIATLVKCSDFTNESSTAVAARGATFAKFARVDDEKISYRRKLAVVTPCVITPPQLASVEASKLAVEYAAFKVSIAAQILAAGQQDIAFLA